MTLPNAVPEDRGTADKLSSVTHAIPALVAYVTPDRRYAVANQVFRQWLHVDPIGRSVRDVLGPAAYEGIEPYLSRALNGERVAFEARLPLPGGERDVEATYIPDVAADGQTIGVVVFVTDVGARKQLEAELRTQLTTSATLARVSQALSRELDLQQLVQVVTDGATELSGAQFGAFFYNLTNESGESYRLYTISGVAREAFSKFPMPRNTKIFDPTFRGAGVVRFDDVTVAPGYGQNPPHQGMPAGHLPVRSYLAVPVISGTGTILGGLFFGHERTGVFTERTEAVITAIASQAGVAIDNSRLVSALREERRQAEDAGRQYRFLSDIVPQLLWAADASGTVDYVNARWVEFTGRDLAASVGEGWHAAMHPDDLPRTVHAWRAAVLAGTDYETTVRMRRADGRTRWMLNRAYPLRDAAGKIVRWFGSCTDVHDQKRHQDSERLLSEASRVLATSLDLDSTLSTVAALVAAWFQGYCIIDLLVDGSLQRVATAHVDPARQPIIDALREFPPAKDRENPLWRVLDSGQSVLCNRISEEMLTNGAQSPRHAELRGQLGTTGYVIAPLLATGRAVGTLMLASTADEPFDADDVRPVDELAYRIAIAITNARAYEEVRRANRLKDEFLAVVSHELRTPLNAMRGWATLLKSGRLSHDQEKHALDVIDRNISAQAQLVDDLLDISRIISGRMRLSVTDTDLGAVVQAAIDSVAPAAAAKGIRVEPALDPSVGLIRADPDRIQQIVWNLLSNAIKFTGRGGRVRVTLQADPKQIELVVADTGQGITPEFLPHVFDRFRQGDSTTTRMVGGLGLGLAIVRHLVELHGGTASAASDGDGLGATFTVRIPRAPAVL